MKLRKPDYYDSFHCIGSACTDTCCAGWEIEVDEESSARYQQLQGALKDKMKRSLTVTEEESYFALQDGRCPFLKKDGLCELICHYGDGILCDICREHPRFYNWYGGDTEVGLGLCCEEAERLIFASEAPARFVTEETQEADGAETCGQSEEAAQEELCGPDGMRENPDEDDGEAQYVDLFRALRERLFSIVQNRRFSLADRLCRCLDEADRMQDALDEDRQEQLRALADGVLWNEETESGETTGTETESGDGMEVAETTDFAALAAAVLRNYEELEALDDSWPALLKQAEEYAAAGSSRMLAASAARFAKAYPQMEWEYEHLMVYFLNRYFLEALYDSDFVSKVRFSVLALLVIRLLELEQWSRSGSRTEADRDRIVRRYSKEIEYCPENVAELVRRCWDRAEFETGALKALIGGLFGGTH